MKARNNIVPQEELNTCKVAKAASLVSPECRHNSTRFIATDTFMVIHSSLLWDSRLTTSRDRGIGCSTTSSEEISGLHFSEGTVCGVSEIFDNAQSVTIWYSLLDKAALSSFIWRFSNKYIRNSKVSWKYHESYLRRPICLWKLYCSTLIPASIFGIWCNKSRSDLRITTESPLTSWIILSPKLVPVPTVKLMSSTCSTQKVILFQVSTHIIKQKINKIAISNACVCYPMT